MRLILPSGSFLQRYCVSMYPGTSMRTATNGFKNTARIQDMAKPEKMES